MDRRPAVEWSRRNDIARAKLFPAHSLYPFAKTFAPGPFGPAAFACFMAFGIPAIRLKPFTGFFAILFGLRMLFATFLLPFRQALGRAPWSVAEVLSELSHAASLRLGRISLEEASQTLLGFANGGHWTRPKTAVQPSAS